MKRGVWMKKLAVLVAGAFLLQQFAPTLLWATTLQEAISGANSSYTFTGNESVTADLPNFGSDKPNHTFTVNGADYSLTGNSAVRGFYVGTGETLNVNNLTLSGFSGEEDLTKVAIINDGILNVNNLTNNAIIAFTGLDPQEEQQPWKGTVNINGDFVNNGYVAAENIVVNENGDFTANLDNLINSTFTNNGIVNAVADPGDEGSTNTVITGTGTLNAVNDLKIKRTLTQGEINVGNGVTVTVKENISVSADEINNDGTYQVNSNATTTAGQLNNDGSYIVKSNATTTAALTNTGTVGIANGGTFYVQGGTNTGAIADDGNLSYGNLVIQGGYGTDTTTPLVFVNNNATAGSIAVQNLTIEGATNNAPAGQFTTNFDAINLVDGSVDYVTNNGILNLTGGTNVKKIVGDGNGIINVVSGTFSNGGNTGGRITGQSEINISQGATFNNYDSDITTQIDTLTNAGILQNERAIAIASSGTNDGVITQTNGQGALHISGDFINNNADANAITQNEIEVTSTGSLKTNAGAISSSHFTNDGSLLFVGNGQNANAVQGTGTTTIAGGTVTQSNTGSIQQAKLNIAAANEIDGITTEGALTTSLNKLSLAGVQGIHITNNGTLTLAANPSANTYNINGTGTLVFQNGSMGNASGATITQGTVQIGESTDQTPMVFSNGGTITGRLVNYGTVSGSGTFTVEGTEENKSINSGSLEGGTEHVLVTGYLDNLANATLLGATVQEGATLRIASANNAGTLKNDGTVELQGGTLTSNISKAQRTGNTDISNLLISGAVVNNATINQSTITVANGGSLQSRADTLTGAITNDGGLTLTGQEGMQITIGNTIAGEGNLTVQNNLVTGGNITQGTITVGEGNELINQTYTVAGAINNSGTISNAGTLTIAGTQQNPSTNSGSVSYAGGTPQGTTNIEGYLQNTGNIHQQNLNVTGTLVTSADNVSATSFVNDGTVVFNGGNISQTITQTTANDGTLNITGTNMMMNNTGNVTQNVLTIADGAKLTAKAGNISVQNLTNDGNLVANLTNVSVNNTFTNNANLTVTGGNVVNAITGANGLFTVSDGDVEITTGSLNQNSVIIAGEDNQQGISAGHLTTQVGKITSANGIENHGTLTLTGMTGGTQSNTTAITGNDGELEITGDVVNAANITQKVVSVDDGVSFTHNTGKITAVLQNNGDFENNATVWVSNGDDSGNEGEITGQGDIVILADAEFNNNGLLSQNSLTINEDGAFTTHLDDLEVSSDIANDGELYLTGGTLANDLTGTGFVGIGGDVILDDNTQIAQGSLLVANMSATSTDPAIVGTLTANASNITTTSGITNDNEITFTGGQNANTITGNGNLIIGTTGTEEVEVTNQAGNSISNTVEITDGNHLIAQAGDLLNTVTNEAGHLTLTGTDAHNVADILGDGDLTVDGTVINDSGVTLENAITINANKSLQAHAADVSKDITNEGAFKIASGNLAVAVTNTDEDTTSGTVEITGTNVGFAQTGSIVQNKLSIANGADFTADMQDGKLTVASIENNGTFNVTGDLDTQITGTGNLAINESLQNNTSVSQQTITIASGKTFTTNGDDITVTQRINNSGVLSLTGGTNQNAVTGSGTVEITGTVENTDGKSIGSLVEITQGSEFAANATDVAHSLTNEGTYEITGGTIGYAVSNENGDTATGAVEISGTGVVLTDGVGITQNALTVNQGGELTANMDDITVASLQNNGAFNVSGDIAQNISGSGTLTIADDLTNTATISQNILSVDNGVTFTTEADLITASVQNQAGTVVFTGGTNGNEITGAGTVEIDGDVATTANIANAITVNANKTLTASAEKLVGAVTNNGTVALTGGLLAQSIAGGTTQVQSGTVALGNAATTFNTLEVAAGSMLDMNEVQASVDTATINGTLNMGISEITKDSTAYTGAKLTATNGVTLGSTSGLQLTFINDAATGLQIGESTGELELIDGTVTGNWAGAVSNNRYKVAAVQNDQGKVVVSYTTTAEEIAQEAGANANEVAAASAWDKENALTNPTAAALNTLSQNDAATYVQALEELTPVQVPMVKTNVSNLNNSIYTAANNHMQYGGRGMAAGDMFSYKSVWMQGLYNKAKNDVRGGFDGDTYGGAVGMDIAAGDETTLGVGYAYANSSLKAEGKKTNADTQNIFLYGNYTGLEDWYFDATLGYNFGKYKETKNVVGVGTGKGDYNVNSIAAQAIAQYSLTDYLSPLAGLRYVFANQGAYDDGLGQHIQSASDHTLTALLGVQAANTMQVGSLVLKPQAKVAALFDIMQDGDDVTVSTGTNSYTVKTEQLEKFGVEAGLSLGVDLSDRVELTLGYDGQFRSHYFNHTGSAKLKYSF